MAAKVRSCQPLMLAADSTLFQCFFNTSATWWQALTAWSSACRGGRKGLCALPGPHAGRQAVEVQGQLGQVAGIVGQGALAPAGDGDFLAELLVKFTESCYISTGSLEEGLLFFSS
jgi:hypothetical protein